MRISLKEQSVDRAERKVELEWDGDGLPVVVKDGTKAYLLQSRQGSVDIDPVYVRVTMAVLS